MKKLVLMLVVVCSLNVTAQTKVSVEIKADDLIEKHCTYSYHLNMQICVNMMNECFENILDRRILAEQTLSQKATEAFYECTTLE